MTGRNYFLTMFDGEWGGCTSVLRDRLNIETLSLHGKEYGNFPTKKELLGKELGYSWNLFRHRREYDGANVIICSNYCALVLLLMRKLHLVHFRKLLWYGVYVHQPGMIRLLRRVIRIARSSKDVGENFKVVVFSRPEIRLYQEGFGLPESNFLYVPYGEWHQDKVLHETGDEGYCFSGGYANRDFVTLAQRFQDKPWRLIIVASRTNTDFVEYCEHTTLSKNIEVYWDIPYEEFDRLMRYAHAIVLLMKYNTGASGQVFLLSALENAKLVVASYTDVVDEYVQDGKTGIVIREKTPEAVDQAMQRIYDPSQQDELKAIARAGHEHYENTFSYHAISDYLVQTIQAEL